MKAICIFLMQRLEFFPHFDKKFMLGIAETMMERLNHLRAH
jgi:hypothetical protein